MRPLHTAGMAPFHLLDDVIVLADAAMRAGAPERIVESLTRGLGGLLATPQSLPHWLLSTGRDGIVRRQLYLSRTLGYEVVAITWAPGQRSAIHDHADTWGIEAVLQGQLDVQDYRETARHRALSQLAPGQLHVLAAGTVIGLLPPHDLHACGNASAAGVAVSLHVYGKHLQQVKRFTHIQGDLYRPQRVMLGTV